MAELTKEDVQKLVSDVVGKEIAGIREEQRDAAREESRQFMEKMLEITGGLRAPPAAPVEKGIKLAQFVRCLSATKGIPSFAADLCKKQGGMPEVVKALGETSFASGGAVVPPDFMGEMIELLRNAVTFRRLGPQNLPMPRGSLTVPYLATGSTAAYVGENSNASKTEPTFGQLMLTAKKLAAVVPVSNDLLRDGGPMVDAVIRDDLVNAFAEREDLAFYRGDGFANTPKGLLNWAVSGNKFNIGNVAGTANGSTLAEITIDLGKAIRLLMDAKIQLRKPAWTFAPRTWQRLYTQRDSNGNLVFKPEMDTGKLFGYPFAVTQQLPTNLGGSTNESEIYFADYGSIVLADTMDLEVSVGDGVAYHDGSNVISGFSQDQTAIRGISRHDLGCRQRGNEVVVIQAVTWGA